ncbi:unnamed protein product, partial [Urochloa humidicola]
KTLEHFLLASLPHWLARCSLLISHSHGRAGTREPAPPSAKEQGQVTAAPIGLTVGTTAWWGAADLNRREGHACATDPDPHEGQAVSCSMPRSSGHPWPRSVRMVLEKEQGTPSRGAIGSSESAVLLAPHFRCWQSPLKEHRSNDCFSAHIEIGAYLQAEQLKNRGDYYGCSCKSL